MVGSSAAKRILIVDDNAVNRRLTELQLKRIGIGSVGADGAATAMKVMAAEGARISLVFMDCYMPGTSGIELTKQLRTDGHLMPILGLSASADPNVSSEALKAGMTAFMTRPLDMKKLKGLLETYLQKSIASC